MYDTIVQGFNTVLLYSLLRRYYYSMLLLYIALKNPF